MITSIKKYNPKKSEIDFNWRLIDAKDQTLGRLATNIAMILMGKNKPTYVPHLLCGDFVVVINSSQIKVTGQKSEKKIYRRFSDYPGNSKEIPYYVIQKKFPNKIIEHAVKGMLPKNKLGNKMFTRLKIYSGPDHPHAAQIIGSDRKEYKKPEQIPANVPHKTVKLSKSTSTSKVSTSKSAKATSTSKASTSKSAKATSTSKVITSKSAKATTKDDASNKSKSKLSNIEDVNTNSKKTTKKQKS
ncbi:MAG: 50S ribosomal protein L13 [Chloroflexi bacterium]|nr:50S ribosomal protein L13 [Chloroflexota bacterium]